MTSSGTYSSYGKLQRELVIVGFWRIGGVNGLCFMLERRPRWLTRFMCRVLLEWEWHDKPE